MFNPIPNNLIKTFTDATGLEVEFCLDDTDNPGEDATVWIRMPQRMAQSVLTTLLLGLGSLMETHPDWSPAQTGICKDWTPEDFLEAMSPEIPDEFLPMETTIGMMWAYTVAERGAEAAEKELEAYVERFTEELDEYGTDGPDYDLGRDMERGK